MIEVALIIAILATILGFAIAIVIKSVQVVRKLNKAERNLRAISGEIRLASVEIHELLALADTILTGEPSTPKKKK